MLFDYWRDPRYEDDPQCAMPPLLDDLPDDRPLYVFVSHHHKDHLNTGIFSWQERFGRIHYVMSKDTARFCRRYLRDDSIWRGPKVSADKVTVLKPGERWSDGTMEVCAFGSTDTGCSYLLRIGGESIFHAGDLNAWIWKDESTPAEVATDLRRYEAILKDIAAESPEIGYVMFPVDSRIGTDYFTGARMFAELIRVGHFFPMHFELADTDEELRQRHKDAIAFGSYARKDYGEYIGLQTPGEEFRIQ